MNVEQTQACKDIIANKDSYLDSLYDCCFEKIKKMVLANSGTEEDVSDIFQEAIIVLYQNCRKEDFTLTCDPCTFLHKVSYNKWMTELKRRRKVVKKNPDVADDNIRYNDNPDMKRERLVAKYFLLLETKCRQILQLSVIEGKRGKDVAVHLNLTYEYYRVAKQRCINSFYKKIESDGGWDELNQ